MTMKATLKVGLSRKEGTTNYGSIGACCDVEVELEDLDELRSVDTIILGLQKLCDRSVELGIKIGRRRVAAGLPAASAPPPATKERQDWSRKERRPEPVGAAVDRQIPNSHGNRNGAGQGRGGYNGAPRNGKQLFPWLSKLEEQGCTGLKKSISAWGHDQGLPSMFNEWTPQEVQAAVAEAQRLMEEGGRDA